MLAGTGVVCVVGELIVVVVVVVGVVVVVVVLCSTAGDEGSLGVPRPAKCIREEDLTLCL